MNPTDFAEQWSSMQKMFLPTSEVSATFRDNARRFWENQDKALDSMQALANAWFDRRHTGTLAAREAAERNRDIRRSGSGVSGVGQRSIRANHGRWTYLPATNHGGDWRSRIAAISAFSERKGGSARAIRGKKPGPL